MTEVSYSDIAIVAQERPNLSGIVAMIYMEPGEAARVGGTADRALPFLF